MPKNPKLPKRPVSNNNSWLRKSLFFAVIAFFVISFLAVLMPQNNLETVDLSNVVDRANDGKIEKMFVEPEKPGDPFEISDVDTMLDYLKSAKVSA